MSDALEAILKQVRAGIIEIDRRRAQVGPIAGDSVWRIEFTREQLADLGAKLEQAEASTAEPVAWRSVERDGLPAIGTRAIVCIGGVVQNEAFELDQGDSDFGAGELFWGRDDLDECPEVNGDDLWMPWPSLYAAPPGSAEVRAQALEEMADKVEHDSAGLKECEAISVSEIRAQAKRIREGG